MSSLPHNKTLVFPKKNEVTLIDCPFPKISQNEVLIRTRSTLISTGTELTMLAGEYPENSYWADYGRYPIYPGYNNIGEVIEIGSQVDREWLGQKVATCGSHAQFVKAPVDVFSMESARKLQRPIKDEHAVFFTIAEIVMNGIRRSNIKWGESVVIYGLGLLGQLAVRFCHLCGARPILAVDVAEERLKRLPESKSIIPVHSLKDNVTSKVRETTRNRMADFVFEVTGNPNLIPSQFESLHKQGRFVILSSPRGKTLFDFHDLCNMPSHTIIGAHNMSHPDHPSLENPWTYQRDAELFFDLLGDNEMNMEPLISHREKYTNAPHLYQMLLKDRSSAMGVVLDWN